MKEFLLAVMAITFFIVACSGGDVSTKQMGIERPYATLQANSTKDGEDVEHVQVHINTRKGYLKCLRETGYGPIYCQRLAVQAEMELRMAAEGYPPQVTAYGYGVGAPNPALSQYAWTDVDPYAHARIPRTYATQPGHNAAEMRQELDLVIEAVAEMSKAIEAMAEGE